MFAKKIISAARFLRMPATARLLYYDLGMYADDDGIVEAFTVLQMTHAALDDLHILTARGFIKILNEDMVSYICDWDINNFIRKDRYVPSLYADLLNGSTTGQPTVNPTKERRREERIGQISLDEERINEDSATDFARVESLSVRDCFINSFGREPDISFLSTILKLAESGITEEQVICQIQESVPRSPRNPEAYVLAALKQIKAQRAQNGVLAQWEKDWLVGAQQYQASRQQE